MAPAWGVVGSYATSPMPVDAEARLAWQGVEQGTPTRPRSEWQLLRGGGASSLPRSAELLRSFENKVASPVSEDHGRRPASAAIFTSTDETVSQQHQHQQQQPSPSGTENDGTGRRHRHPHHRPLPREQEEGGGEGGGGGGGGGEDVESMPSLRSRNSLASMHNRPGSSSWVHRRSLPSLLSGGTAEAASSWSTQRTTAEPTPPREPSGGAAAARKRGKRRTPLQEPSGRMQRLDKTSTTVTTVGDAFARGGGPSRGARGNAGWNSSQTEVISAGGFGDWREAARAAIPPQGLFEGGQDGGTADRIGNFRRGGTPSGTLLSSAIPKPLLYVGSGGGFRLRS
eukprot:g7277.t1